MIFSKIGPEQINGLWPAIMEGVYDIFNRTQGTFGWTPFDVREAILRNSAELYMAYENNKRVGFVVLRNFIGEFNRSKYLHVWLGYLNKENRNKGFLKPGMEWLIKEATKRNASYIELDSNRTGWGRKLLEYNMKPHRTVYRKEI